MTLYTEVGIGVASAGAALAAYYYNLLAFAKAKASSIKAYLSGEVQVMETAVDASTAKLAADIKTIEAVA